jgi:glycosyltransferase involved in cell wall biosynthesis
MRVLVFTNMYPYPAMPFYGSFVRDEVISLKNAGVEVDVYFVNGKNGKLNYLGAPFGLWRRLRGGNYDIVHVHHSFCAFFATMQKTVPVVWTFHEGEISSDPDIIRADSRAKRLAYSKGFKRRMARRVDAVIVVSAHLRQPLGRPDATVLPCGIDTALFAPMNRSDALERLGLDPATTWVLFPSERDRMGKRFDLAAAGVARLRETTGRAAELLCLDAVPHEEVPVYMNASSVFLMTSAFEASPVTVREALACNIPVVSTDVGDVKTMVDGIDGCFIIDPDPGDIAAALDRALDRTAPFEGRGKMGRYSHEATAEKLVGLYESLISTGTDGRNGGKPDRKRPR